ncbi:MAG TPA: cell cycle transcriptional regulator TrcR, partial [Devosia sp.]|nr:cell cycle transcriptional regulator TrcR [Devosia sp.]
GELTHEEIERGQANPSYVLKMQKAPVQVSRTKGPRYTPVSKRQDKPDGIAWILRNHPEISDAQVSKLIGTTRNTIAAIRDRSHWNIQNIQPKDPVTLGLCSQRELDAVVAKAAKKAGIDPVAPLESSASDDRQALIDELRAERDAATQAAVEAAQEAEVEAWLEAKRAAEAAEGQR